MLDFLNQNALAVLEDRYLLKDENGRILETPLELFGRVAEVVSNGDSEKFQTYFELMTSGRFLPNSPTLMNAGKKLGNLSACFVIPIEDSMDSIFTALHDQAIIQKWGGGTGFSFDKISEDGAYLNISGGRASGPISFMGLFNHSSSVVEQGGTRRGANMGTIGADHPNIFEFIRLKNRKKCPNCGEEMWRNISVCPICGNKVPFNNDFSYFNLSVSVNLDFIKKAIDLVENGKDSEWKLISRRDGRVVKVVKFSELWNELVYNAWYSGEPGILNLHAINMTNPIIGMDIESTNPCGEQPLLPYDACNLGSINVDILSDHQGDFNYAELEDTVRKSVRFLNDVIDVNKYPLDKVRETVLNYRNIGLGMMGFSRWLQKKEIPYDSEEARNSALWLGGMINEIAKAESSTLAIKYGNFPAYPTSIYADSNVPRRNATVTTIAPTGSISIIAGTSSGIEPDFAHCYDRIVKRKGEGEFTITVENPVLVDKLKKYGLYSEKIMQAINVNNGILPESSVISHLEPFNMPMDLNKGKLMLENWEYLRMIFETASEISVDGHVQMLLTIQKCVENAVSKTVNLPNSATQEDVAQAFIQMLKGGAKGITVYRDGSREGQPIQTFAAADTAKNEEDQTSVSVITKERIDVLDRHSYALKELDYFTNPLDKLKWGEVLPASDKSPSMKIRVTTGCGKFYLHADYNPSTGRIFETFVEKGKSGGGCKANLQALGILVSYLLRAGVPVEKVAQQLIDSPNCASYIRARTFNDNVYHGASCPNALGYALLELNDTIKRSITPDVINSYTDGYADPKTVYERFGYEIESIAQPHSNSRKILPASVCFPAPQMEYKLDFSPRENTCPDCGEKLVNDTGCFTCKKCGYSKC